MVNKEVDPAIVAMHDNRCQGMVDDVDQQNIIELETENEEQVHLEAYVQGSRRSHRERKSTLDTVASDYVVYL